MLNVHNYARSSCSLVVEAIDASWREIYCVQEGSERLPHLHVEPSELGEQRNKAEVKNHKLKFFNYKAAALSLLARSARLKSGVKGYVCFI